VPYVCVLFRFLNLFRPVSYLALIFVDFYASAVEETLLAVAIAVNHPWPRTASKRSPQIYHLLVEKSEHCTLFFFFCIWTPNQIGLPRDVCFGCFRLFWLFFVVGTFFSLLASR